jgi:hypothetical protein
MESTEMAPGAQPAPFQTFAVRHGAVNRWFRSTEVAYRAAKMLAHSKSKESLVRDLFPRDWRRDDTLKQYRGRYSESGRAPRATIADFLLDLRDDWEDLLDSVVVNEVGALEMFLREWAMAAFRAALEPRASRLTAKTKQSLVDALAELQSSPYKSVSLTQLGAAFPAVKAALDSTTHLGAFHPLLSPATGTLTCRSVANLWREVRNLILHHDRLVHERFVAQYAQLWYLFQTDARERGSLVVARRCRVGFRLPIDARHVIFCLTTCYQTAVVLHVATGGSNPSQPVLSPQKLEA